MKKNIIKAVIVGTSVIIALSGCTSKAKTDTSLPNAASASDSASLSPTPSKTDTPTSTPSATAPAAPTDANAEEVSASASFAAIPNNAVPWGPMSQIVIATTTYLQSAGPHRALGVKDGYFYDFGAKDKVHVDAVVNQSDFPQIDLNQSDIFVIMPSDLKGYKGLTVIDGNAPEFFFVIKVEDGYAVCGERSKGGILTFGEYNDLLGKIKLPKATQTLYAATSGDFGEISYVVANDLKSKNGVDVRYMKGDSHYAVVIFSPKGKPSEVHGYVMELKKDGWYIAVKDFQKEYWCKQLITMKLPKFDTTLLPDYNLNDYLGKYTSKESIDNIIQNMLNNKLITEADMPAVFETGQGNFVYMEFKSKKAFVGRSDSLNADAAWVTYPVRTTADSNEVLKKNSSNPPYVILKQY